MLITGELKLKTSLYFHVPFCTKKCPYCHFYVIPNRPAYQTLLEECFEIELGLQKPLLLDRSIPSIYFGGGTPSLFSGLGAVLGRVERDADCEITIEANPEESSLELFTKFTELGINRLSLGVQSLDDRSLQMLERVHTAKRAKKAIFEARAAGFKNISIDLMYDLPGQTEESWLYTLDQLQDLPIQHLSLYNLTIEPHTAFHKRKVKTTGGELSLRFLTAALDTFERIGLKRYEISAFAHPGFESRHNLGYWTGRPFLGFGPSAFSYWGGERFRNVANIHKYARSLRKQESAVDFREKLSFPANIRELLAIHLRLKEGVDLSVFDLDEETRRSMEKLEKLELLSLKGQRAKLTERGMLYYDSVAAEII